MSRPAAARSRLVPKSNSFQAFFAVSALFFQAISSSFGSEDILGSWPDYVQGSINEIQISGSVAYLVGWDIGLVIMDVDDPAKPKAMYQASLSGGGKTLRVQDNILYVAGGSGVRIFDVSNPLEPVLIPQHITAPTYDIALQGDTLYTVNSVVIDGEEHDTLNIYDVSQPNEPVKKGTLEAGGDITDMVCGENLVYLAFGRWGGDALVKIVDVTDKEKPAHIGSYDPGLKVGSTFGAQLDYNGEYLFLVAGTCTSILDISEPENVIVKGTMSNWSSHFDITVEGNLAYVANHSSGLTIYNITDPSNPVVLSRVAPRTYTVTGAVGNGHYYAVDMYDGLHIHNVEAPENPYEVARGLSCFTVEQVQIEGNYAYLAAGWNGFVIVDISDPKNMLEVDSYLVDDATAIEVRGNLAYVAGGRHSGFWVFDVTDKEDIQLVGELPRQWHMGTVNKMDVADGYAYLAIGYCNGWSGIQILDVRAPTNPSHVGAFSAEDHLFSVEVQGDKLFFCDSSDFYIVDITDRSQPVLLGKTADNTLAGPSAPRMAISGSRAYCNRDNNLLVIDFSDPRAPVVEEEKGRTFLTCVSKIIIHNNHVFVQFEDSWSGTGALHVYANNGDFSQDPIMECSKASADFYSYFSVTEDLIGLCSGGLTLMKNPIRPKQPALQLVEQEGGLSCLTRHTNQTVSYEIECSTDLVRWETAFTVVGNGHTCYTCLESLRAEHPALYFRIKNL